ncbi:glycosyltransferase family 4 protein [Cohnella soli]|uniref:Glycosyltransferase family 4 protein n=1 Tax=Cohnella soli TaxID=425005 RepID=A0ABW0HZ55_9BACL
MKVLFVFIVPSGGVDTLNRYRYVALLPSGIYAHFLYFNRGSGASNHPPDMPVFFASDPPTIGVILDYYQFDCIVVTSFYIQLALFRELGYSKPIVFEIQGFGPPEQARASLIDAFPFVDKFANGIVYPETPLIGKLLSELYPSKRRFSFPNPFDAEKFAAMAGSPQTPLPYIPLLWVGRLEDNKNWQDFLLIGAETIKRKPGTRLWMFGDPALAEPGQYDQFRLLASLLGVLHAIHHLHDIPNAHMPAYYSLAAQSGGVLCMTSKSEGAPYAALEALSCGCPIVTTDSGGVRSTVLAGKTGLYYEHGNIEEAADQICRVLGDTPLRARIAKAGAAHVRKEFAMNRYAANFANMMFLVGVPPC